MASFTKVPDSDEQNIVKINIAAHVVSSATSFRQADQITDLIKAIGRKDPLLTKLKLGRTKCTKLITRVLAPGFQDLLLKDIGQNKFSLLIDESTDVTTSPMLCMALRYISVSQRKCLTSFYRLVRLEGKDAETITNAILAALEEDGLDIQYLIGLGTDGTSTLIGHRSGVYARLKERQPELVVAQCVCHSLAKTAEYVFNKLPSNLEVLLRDVDGYFSHSSTRKDRYEQLFVRINGAAPKKLLKSHNVRWLSLFQCVDAILKQWDELREFFEHEKDVAKSAERFTARQLYEMMLDQNNKVFLSFCRWFLKPFIEKNLLFQSENVDVLKLINELDIFYVNLLRKFVVLRQLENYRISNTDMSQFDFQNHICHIDMMEFGIDFQEELSKVHLLCRLVTLKKHLQKFGIKRNDTTFSAVAVASAIDEERGGTGMNFGIRMMYKALRNRHGLLVSR